MLGQCCFGLTHERGPSTRLAAAATCLALWAATSGCAGILGMDDLNLQVELVDQGSHILPEIPPPTVRVGRGLVAAENTVYWQDTGYRIRARALRLGKVGAGPPGLVIIVDTERPDGDVLALQVFRRFRLTLDEIPAGSYRLRLIWNDEFDYRPEYRQRVVSDTLLIVP